ncbi:serine protease inhibitor 42Dd-like [Drosophila ficusphila]|uniref:serine protease inhibitor 42Dd-like n=1 Tax=Drosophila ficusphila TaxID=30025 RepID=UPI0007E82389|nr:serine protease inhibitor 42Dd-like [Drosophila ficusphila]
MIFGLFFLVLGASGHFTDDLYLQLARNHSHENVISSPLSVEIAIAMTYLAAGGETAQEIEKTLKLPSDRKVVAKKYKELLENIEGREKVATLYLANRIYVVDKYRINPGYNEMVKDSFKAEAKSLNVNDPSRAAAIVNNWVNETTRGKIDKLVTEDDVSNDLVAMLLNAIYFKGQWQYKFNPDETKKEDFRVSDQKRVPVEMMNLETHLRYDYVESLDVQVVELPFLNSSLNMVIYLPKKVEGLKALEEQISGFSVSLIKTKVFLKLPKFKIEFTKELSDILQNMGIKKAFEEDAANFTDLVNKDGVYISKVKQKAFIEVNEEGAEAAAVTVAETSMYISMPLPSERFVADHPFAYVIRDENTIYFQGHYVNPEAK